MSPRDQDAPTVVSLFAGCGGSSLGYRMAGFREVLAVEWDPNAAACFRANFPEVPLYEGDVTQLTDHAALELAGLEPGQLDVLDGSPPCQGFSTAGHRILDDPRNALFREHVRLLKAFRPRALVLENVSGMVKGKMKLAFAEIIRELKACGYRVSCRLLDAQWFDVPQARQRVIFLGLREDLEQDPRHPRPRPRQRFWALREVLPSLMATRSQRINPWMSGDGPAATVMAQARGYEATFAMRENNGFRGHPFIDRAARPAPVLLESDAGAYVETDAAVITPKRGGYIPTSTDRPAATLTVGHDQPRIIAHDGHQFTESDQDLDKPAPTLLSNSAQQGRQLRLEPPELLLADNWPNKTRGTDRPPPTLRANAQMWLQDQADQDPDSEPPPIPERMHAAIDQLEPGNFNAHDAERIWRANGLTSGYGNAKRLGEERPACTLPSLQPTSGAIVHPTVRRSLTIDEAKIIGSFPEPFVLVGNYQQRWARIGNSVPPLLMRAIARDLRCQLAGQDTPPDDLYDRAARE